MTNTKLSSKSTVCGAPEEKDHDPTSSGTLLRCEPCDDPFEVGAIAHDLNNILTAVSMHADLGLAHLGVPETTKRALTEIRNASLRAKELVRRILAFSRRDERRRGLVDLPKVLAETISFVEVTLPSSIQVTVDAPANCPPVWADESRLHQVFVNLASNAAGAMPGGGLLAFDVREADIRVPPELATGTIAPGPCLVVSVTDTGLGMSQSTAARIFEPFFTTKPTGEGTGLGLAIVARIVAEHGGGVAVETRPGSGSTFALYFPIPNVDTDDAACPA